MNDKPHVETLAEALKIFAEKITRPETQALCLSIVQSGHVAKITIAVFAQAEGKIGARFEIAEKSQPRAFVFGGLD